MSIIITIIFMFDLTSSLYKMVYYSRIDISESIDVNKSEASKKCMVCHYYYFRG